MSNTFKITKNSQIVLYGTGGNAGKIRDVFCASGKEILGYIDRRAGEIKTFKESPVWTIDEFSILKFKVERIVVIITIKNVFEHQEIAYKLVQKGYRNLIYVSQNSLRGKKNLIDNRIKDAYDALAIQHLIPWNIEIPHTLYEKEIFFEDRFFIRKNKEKNMITTWIPIELLFNYKDETPYSDMNMGLFFPIVNLYQFLLGQIPLDSKEAIENYIIYVSQWIDKNGYCLTDGLRQSLIDSRAKIFNEMQKIKEIDFEFFIRSAPKVKLGQSGHFNMVESGRNRICFLIANQMRYVPVKMSQSNYREWLKESRINSIKNHIMKENINSFFAPIAHPYLASYPSRAVDYLRIFCIPIAEKMMKIFFKESLYVKSKLKILKNEKIWEKSAEVSVLCSVKDEGTLSRYLKTLKFDVYRYKKALKVGEKVTIETKTMELFDDFFDVPFIPYIDRKNTGPISVSIFEFWEDTEDNHIILKLTQQYSWVLVYGNHEEFEKFYERNGFVKEKIIFSTIWESNFVSAFLIKRKNKQQ